MNGAQVIPWFTPTARIARLHEVATTWLGTPFSANGNTRGPNGGVCCHKLCAEIFREVGFWDGSCPDGHAGHARYSQESLILPWMASLATVREIECSTVAIRAGDILGMTIGRVVHHMGLALGNTKFVHVMSKMGCCVSTMQDATWATRLARIWRPIEIVQS